MLTKSHAKYIQSLSQKKFRDEEDAFIAEGPKIINELLQSKNTGLKQLYALQSWADENKPFLNSISDKFIEITEKDLERISFLQSPNQVLGVFKKPLFEKNDCVGKISLLLDCIQDPGNLGTIVRTADWFGIENIICSTDSADVFNPKVVQATMGSISRVQVIYEDLKKFIQKNQAIPVYATAPEGNSLFEMKKIKEGFVLIGNESKGIQTDLFLLAHQKITIPKKGYAESLNAAVAAGIMMAWTRGF
ncbi:MAG TPA: RNA methyltransferase [Puia sp.]|nr:RNA methyltransferase [Puia sp.]